MFPRRRTDQVYATLQQVQRRITEQGGGQASTVSTPAGMSAPASNRTPASGTPTPGPMPAIRPGPQIRPQDALPPAPPLLPPGVGAHQRYSVVLSGTLASLLLVCWIASIAAAILITKQVVKPGAATVGEPAPRTAAAEAVPAAGRSKLIVASEMRATPDAQARLAKERDYLNDAFKRNSWPALFSLEEEANGSIQLVFGAGGVDKAQHIEYANKLMRRHTGARWVDLR